MAPKRVDVEGLARRLAGYGLGVGAVAAGMALPQKADADIIYETFTGIEVNCVPDHIILRFGCETNLYGLTSNGCAPGFDFCYGRYICGVGACTDRFYFNGIYNSCAAASYYMLVNIDSFGCVLGPVWWTAPGTSFDLASFNTDNYEWAFGHAGTQLPLYTNRSTIVGLHMHTAIEDNYGWASFISGSFVLEEAAFNNTDDGPIYPGQIPEPSSLLLLLSGAVGLSALRKRRGTS